MRCVQTRLLLGACHDQPISTRYRKYITLSLVRCYLTIHNQMASSPCYKNLPTGCTEMSALKELLDGDLELRSFLLRRQDKAQAQYTYAKKAADVFADCLATTRAVKDAYAASILSTKALENVLRSALNLYDNHHDILVTISSSKGMLATWTETVALAEALLTRLDQATPQVETHLQLAADERAAHESAHVEASESMLPCPDSLRAVDRSIAKKRAALFGVRNVPTEILPQIFIEAVDARQHEIITSLPSYHDPGSSFHDLNALSKTLNLVPFTLSATCKRWRAICQSTPRLWRYARVPMIHSTRQGNKITGKKQFERCVLLAQSQPLELTVYPCYDVTHGGASYPNLVLPAESQTLKVNIVWHSNSAIPSGIPSPIELYIVASANSPIPYKQVLSTQLLANTKTLRCRGLTPRINSAVGIQNLHISHIDTGEVLPSGTFRRLLQNCPQLEELHFENPLYPPTQRSIFPFTHQQLHSLSIEGIALPSVIGALSAGCRFPHMSRLVLTDINGRNSDGHRWIPPHSISDQLSLLTHIEVHAASEPIDVVYLLPLFEASTGLRTLTLVDGAVEPMLILLAQLFPKRVQEVRLSHSDANGTTLRDYLVAIERDGGSTSGMRVIWSDCPNFLSNYGGVSGELQM